MDKEVQLVSAGTSRAELIKQARASCMGKMDGTTAKPKAVANQNVEQMEKKRIPFIKSFVIRLVTAGILFVALLSIDQWKVNHKYLNSETILKQIGSNVSINQLEDYVSSFIASFTDTDK